MFMFSHGDRSELERTHFTFSPLGPEGPSGPTGPGAPWSQKTSQVTHHYYQ